MSRADTPPIMTATSARVEELARCGQVNTRTNRCALLAPLWHQIVFSVLEVRRLP